MGRRSSKEIIQRSKQCLPHHGFHSIRLYPVSMAIIVSEGIGAEVDVRKEAVAGCQDKLNVYE